METQQRRKTDGIGVVRRVERGLNPVVSNSTPNRLIEDGKAKKATDVCVFIFIPVPAVPLPGRTRVDRPCTVRRLNAQKLHQRRSAPKGRSVRARNSSSSCA
eukprot:INCI20096.1.p2 GENE.INCI20096.1~~INCI20096.1.p2  ORF type:complete len:102 (+),score=10.01 INCI20096.1:55-360(+)